MPLSLKPSILDYYVGRRADVPDATEIGVVAVTQHQMGTLESITVPMDTNHLDSVRFVTLDGRLVKFELDYDESTAWETKAQVVQGIADALGMNASHFDEVTSWAECSDFEVRITPAKAGHSYNLTVEISEKDIDDVIKQRDDARRKRKEANFNP